MANLSRYISHISVLLLLLTGAMAQNNWERLNRTQPNRYVSSLCVDTIRDRLYIGGDFRYVNNVEYPGIFEWDGTAINQMGCGVGHCGNIDCGGVRGMVMHKGNLFALFLSDSIDCKISYSVDSWDGNQWLGLNQQYFLDGFNSTPTSIFSFDSILVVNGPIDSIRNQNAFGQVQFDGSSWSNFLYCPLMSNQRLGKYQIINFQGDYYAFNLEKDTMGQYQNFSKWNGTCWEKVPNVFDSFDMAIYKMIVYQGELYVAGSFNPTQNSSFPGFNIAKFNGQSWDDLKGGLTGNTVGSLVTVRDMAIHDGDLYVVGYFRYAGGIPASNIARWNGNQWCSFGNQFDNVIGAVASYHDTLFIGGGFHTIDGDSTQFIVKWIGGNYVDSCTTPTSISEIDFQASISVAPNPVQDVLRIKSERVIVKSVQIFSLIGKQIANLENINTFEANLSVEFLSSGIYFLQIETELGKVICKKAIKD
jgi:hypothetical protein